MFSDTVTNADTETITKNVKNTITNIDTDTITKNDSDTLTNTTETATNVSQKLIFNKQFNEKKIFSGLGCIRICQKKPFLFIG